MKKSLILCGLLIASVASSLGTSAMAGFQGPTDAGGAVNMSVTQVLELRLDRYHVCMTGRITSRLATDNEKYMFQDMSGSLVVEIDDKVFAGQFVTPDSRILICGEVDAEMLKPSEFEAETLRVQP